MNRDVARHLFDSDRAYFAAGADSLPIAGGTLRWMAGLQHLEAGCIVEPDAKASMARFAPAALEGATAIGARQVRFYTPDDCDRGWADEGFSSAVELAFARRPDFASLDRTIAIRPVVTSADWATKQALANENGDLPDGKAAPAGEWTLLERRKSDAGYARFYLAELEGQACATFALADCRPLLRLKNLVVLPRWRRRGLAREIIAFALRYGAAGRFDWVGLYSLERGPGPQLYASCGFERVGAQIEWTRPASAAAPKVFADLRTSPA